MNSNSLIVRVFTYKVMTFLALRSIARWLEKTNKENN